MSLNQDIFLTILHNLQTNLNKSVNYKLHYIHNDKKPQTISADFLSFLFIHENITLTISERELICFPGNIIIVKQGTTITIPKSENHKIFILHFKETFFDHYLVSQLTDCPIFYDMIHLENEKEEYLFFDCTQSSITAEYEQMLLYKSSAEDPLDDKMVKCAFILFLTNLHRIHHAHLIISESSMMPDYSIGKFLKYMTKHYKDVTLVSMAEHFNFHPSYFSSLFKSLSGYTFSEKLLMIKLEQAKRLLLTSDFTIQQIAEMIGFQEKSYFHKSFKKYYGMTPANYRKLNK